MLKVNKLFLNQSLTSYLLANRFYFSNIRSWATKNPVNRNTGLITEFSANFLQALIFSSRSSCGRRCGCCCFLGSSFVSGSTASKSRIIQKDAAKIVAIADQLKSVTPAVEVTLICTRNICSKSLALLESKGIGVLQVD